MNHDNGDKLLIIPGSQVIVGLELSSAVSPMMVVDSLKSIINRVSAN